MLFESNKLDMMRSLPVGDVLLILLHFDVLFVSKCGHIVNNCEATLSFAILALTRLLNSLSEDRGQLSMVAIDTSEVSIFDFRHNTAASDNDSFYLDQLIDIIRPKVSL